MQTKSLQLPLVVFLVVGLSVLFLFGCANQKVASSSCQELDWYELGRTDGAKGLVPGSPRDVKPICPQTNLTLSRALYNNGYDSTIASFCTYQQGFAAAINENSSANVNRCPQLLRGNYQRGYASGSRFVALQKSRHDIAARLQSLNAYLNNRSIALPRRAILHGQKIMLEHKIKTVKRELASIQKERALN